MFRDRPCAARTNTAAVRPLDEHHEHHERHRAVSPFLFLTEDTE
ncbi:MULTISPECIES: hypothetical protein [unclassified Streptomyces]